MNLSPFDPSPFVGQILGRFDHKKRTRLLDCFSTNKEGLRSWLIGNMNELLMDAALSLDSEYYPVLAEAIITNWNEA